MVVIIAVFSVFHFNGKRSTSASSVAPVPAHDSSLVTRDTSSRRVNGYPGFSGQKEDTMSQRIAAIPESNIVAMAPIKNQVPKVSPAAETDLAKELQSARPDSLLLVGLTNANVLLRISTDGTAHRDYSLQPNMRRLWKARDKIVLSLSDAGAVVFTLNGKKIGRLGKPGDIVRDVVLSKRGIRRQ
jgi:hypothetical protein